MHVNHALHGENLFLIYYSLLKVKLNFLVSSVITAYYVGRGDFTGIQEEHCDKGEYHRKGHKKSHMMTLICLISSNKFCFFFFFSSPTGPFLTDHQVLKWKYDGAG